MNPIDQRAPAPTPAPELHGIDVSHYQGHVDWPTVAKAGVSFAYVKLTEGVTWRDPYGARNLEQARLAGLRVGAYHYLTASDPHEQARAFLDALGLDVEAMPPRLPPMLDLESPRLDSDAADRALVWLHLVEEALGVAPFVYTFPDFAETRHLERCPELARFPLWIAHYGVSAPRVPRPWGTWVIWQKSGGDRVPGIGPKCDVDVARALPL